ncbi:MAG: hypothetical protein ACD_11C00116G0023 [uncultured bacterium]|nr:MAG: hypothetical protein ACD_11C00116G0023 [uncultured bacterium]HBR71232.1 hypothetical protein [Candidatus Moranbacteria bacterium]
MEKNKIKTIIPITVFIILDVILFKLFPAEGIFQQIVAMFSFFVVTPFLFNIFVLKNKISRIGFSIGKAKEGIFFSTVSMVVGLLIFYIIFNYFDFLKNYTLSDKAVNNFSYFIYYELVQVLFVNFIFEVFFRGFIMFNYQNYFGYWTIGTQWIIFIILLVLNSGFNWFFVPYIIFFPLAGFIAYKSRSIWYSLAAQSIFIFIIDIIVVKLKY